MNQSRIVEEFSIDTPKQKIRSYSIVSQNQIEILKDEWEKTKYLYSCLIM